MNEIKLYKAPAKALKLIFLASLFVAIGVWGLSSGRMPGWMAWTSIVFFGMGYPVGLFHLFDRRPQVIISELGIFDRTTHRDFINWEIIRDAYLLNIHKQVFICLVVDEEFKPSARNSSFRAQAAKFNEAVGAQELNISLGQLKIDPVRFTEFILLMRTASKPERVKLLESGADLG